MPSYQVADNSMNTPVPQGGAGNFLNNPLVGQIGGAAMGIGSELLRENNDSYYDQSGMLPSFVGLIGHNNQDVNVDDNEFNRNIYQQNYQAEENPYSKDAGSIAKRIGHTTLNDAGKGLQYGGGGGALIGGGAGLITGVAGEFINKRKNQEFEDEMERNKQAYKDQQMSFIGDRNDQIRNYAQQEQLANRGIPNYNTNAYNV